MYKITFARSARKELESLPNHYQDKILEKIEQLAITPRPNSCKKIRGMENSWRIRVGDYRVIYEIDAKQKIVDIVVISHRQSAYKE